MTRTSASLSACVAIVALFSLQAGCQQDSSAPTLSIGEESAEKADPQKIAAEKWLLGRWHGRVELNRSKLGATKLTEADIKNIESAKMSIEFKPGGMMNMSAEVQTPQGPQSRQTKASWKILRVDGGSMTVETYEEGHPAEIVTIERNGEHFTMPAPDDMGVTRFQRE